MQVSLKLSTTPPTSSSFSEKDYSLKFFFSESSGAGKKSIRQFQEKYGEIFSTLTFICSNSAIETLEKGVKYFQN